MIKNKYPILLNHDATTEPIGWLIAEEKGLRAKFEIPLTKEELFRVFGDVAFQVIKCERGPFSASEHITRGEVYSEILIYEFSLTQSWAKETK